MVQNRKVVNKRSSSLRRNRQASKQAIKTVRSTFSLAKQNIIFQPKGKQHMYSYVRTYVGTTKMRGLPPPSFLIRKKKGIPIEHKEEEREKTFRKLKVNLELDVSVVFELQPSRPNNCLVGNC